MIKQHFGFESYLRNVSNIKYRQAISRLRTSSHSLQIEKCRHSKSCININDRLCTICNEVEDEIHFLVSCTLYSNERYALYRKIELDNIIANSEPSIIFCYLMYFALHFR